MNLNWHSIRAIDGSQAKGFEELIAQLACTETPTDARFERVGAPDAGVECYCVLEDGSEWGWQAKYFTSALNNSQWAQLDDSVKTALDKHPALTRYYVCIPWDRSDARIPSRKSAMQRWDEHVSKWQGWAQERGVNVEFVWWGKSELIERLSRPEHIGRTFFWFDERYFDEAWYAGRLQEAIDAAGPRYTPEIHVDLDIAQDLEMFGRTDDAINRIKEMAREVRRESRTIGLSRKEEESLRESANVDILGKRMNRLTQCVSSVLHAFSDLQSTPIGELPIANIVARIEAAEAPVGEVSDTLDALSREYESQQGEDDIHSTYRSNPFRNLLHSVERLRYRLQRIIERLNYAGEIANSQVMILKGEAGTGKTHLLCDVASSRISDGAPTVLLMGQQFTDSTEPWTQALQHLDMRDANAEQFVGALEASAQVADRRALLIIDAVNEGRGREIWPPNMSAFLTRVGKSPWIGMIFSVRSSYEQDVVPAAVLEKAIISTHYGFAGREYDAVRTFAEHYGIEFPSTPILQPEFRNPLFLKVICKGLQGMGERRIPRGLSGVTSFFTFYLDAVNERLAETLNYNPKDNLVRRALEKVAERMVDLDMGTRWLPRQEAEEVVNALLPGRGFRDSLYRALVVEGVLAEELDWSDSKPEEVARFAYERFSDHIVADFLLQEYMDTDNPQAAFMEGGLAFLCDRSIYVPPGILEALLIQVPERTGHELVRLAPTLLDNPYHLATEFLSSIVWRDPAACSQDTLVVLDEIANEAYLGNQEVLDTMLTVSTVPEHPFNAKWLDDRLRGHTMPERDVWWSIYLHDAWRHGNGPVHRLVDWASGISADDEIEDEVVELSSTVLAWMFSTPNRFLRDRATKALVSLLTDGIAATIRLVNRFNGVDDPYVRERVYAVAYGVSMRSQDAAEIEKLGRAVYENIFAAREPTTHILLRDYARGVVERAMHLNPNSTDFKEELISLPYKSNWPRIPDDSEIELLTPHWNSDAGRHGTLEWARNRVRWSVMDDDFAHYVIGTNSSHYSSSWLNVGLEEDMWRSPDERLQILLQNMSNAERLAYDEFKKAEDERHKVDVVLMFLEFEDFDSKDEGNRLCFDEETKQDIETDRARLLLALTEEHRSELESIWQAEKPLGFDLSLVQRYIVWRVFDLGWTVNRFGHFDSLTIGYSGRDAHKAERIGKKYQWIAYHEILAHLADSYQYLPDYGSGRQIFEGTWQEFLRDIDPSCTLTATRGGTGWNGHNPSWWARTPYEAWKEDASHQAWLDEKSDIPNVEELLRVTHPSDGTNWLVVDGSFTWQQPHSADVEPYDNPRRQMWIGCQGYFIHAADAAEFMSWAKKVHFWGRWMPESYRLLSGEMFLGEYPWSPAFDYFINSLDSDCDGERWSDARGKCPVPLMAVSFSYSAEGSGFDCSIDDGFSLNLPTENFVKRLGLEWTGKGADFIDEQGRVVAFDPTAYEDGPSALLIREEAMNRFLAENDLALCWTVVGEKTVGGIHDRHQNLKFTKLTGAYRFTGQSVEGFVKPPTYW